MKKRTSLLSAMSAAVVAVVAAVAMLGFGSTAAHAEMSTVPVPSESAISRATLDEYKSTLFRTDSFEYGDDYTLNYRYYKSGNASEKMPLIVCLHGQGERGDDNDSQLNNAFVRPFIESEDSRFYDAMVIAPQCPVKDFGNGWVDLFDNEEDARASNFKAFSVDTIAESVECKAVVALINETCKNNNVDTDRIYLIGLSQGAMAIWDLLARHGDMFAAAVPIAGVGDPTKAEIYADIPIYAFHGTADKAVKYDGGTIVLYEAINALGKGKMNFASFTGGQHAVWESAIVYKGDDKLPALEDWLFAQSKAEPTDKPQQDEPFNYAAVIIPIVAVVVVVVVAAVAVAVVLVLRKNKRGE